MASRRHSSLVRLYARLVAWLVSPSSPEAGREMVAVFTDAYEDAAGELGLGRRLSLTATAFLDLLVTSAALAWRRERAGLWTSLSSGLSADLKLACRGLVTRGRFSLFVVASLALGIGANTAIFSVLHATLLRPLPLAHGERVVAPIALRNGEPFQVSAFDYREWRASARSFDAFGLSTTTSFALDVDGEPERLEAARVTASYFDTLGAKPFLGRGFVEDDLCCRESPAAILSYALWQRLSGGRGEVVGELIRLDGVAHAIVGVMPPGLDVPFATDLWVPLVLDRLEPSELQASDYFAVLRLAEGVSLEEGRAELRTIAARLEREHPDTHNGLTTEAIMLRQHLLVDFEDRLEHSLIALLASVGLLLLVACANVSNLFLARSLGRSHELALRASLGAGRFQLVRHVLLEAIVLSGLGGLAALALARGATPLLSRLSPVEPLAMANRLGSLEIDGAVLLFTLAVSLLTGLTLGLVSAVQISRTNLSGSLRSRAATLRGRRVMRTLVVAQVAMAVVLATGAGLTLSSLRHLRGLSLGFEPEDVWAVRLQLPPRPAAERITELEAILARVRAIPGVEAAGLTTNLPADHLSWDAVYTARGGTPFDPRRVPFTADRLVSDGYLETIGVELVSGRLLEPSDRADSEPVAVITHDFAERAWPGMDPLGKQVKRGAPDSEAPWLTVVGVVEPVKEDRAAFRRNRPAWYLPVAQVATERDPTLVMRFRGDPASLLASVRAAVHETAPAVPVYGFIDLEAHVAELFSRDRFGVALLSVFSGLGLLLASVGVYGLLASAVASRTREIGVRIALGADERRLAWALAREGLTLGGKGTLLGIAAALAAGRLVSGLLFDVSPLEPAVLGTAAGLGVAVSLVASYAPARRVAAVDPVRSIRAE